MIRIKKLLKIKPTWWAGYLSLDTYIYRLSISYKFLGWRNKSWRENDILGNNAWKYWFKNPLLGYKKWDDGRINICILYNDFTFSILKKENMNIYYEV